VTPEDNPLAPSRRPVSAPASETPQASCLPDRQAKGEQGLIEEMARLRRRVGELEALEPERRRVTDALRRGVTRLHVIVSRMPVVLWSCDLTGLLTVVEGKGVAALGVSAHEMIGKTLVELHPDPTSVGEHIRRAARGEAHESLMRGGTRMFEVYTSSLRDARGKVAGVLGVSSDVTELLRTRERLVHANAALSRKASELAAANGELAEYASAVSHHIKAPLRAIHNYASFLLDDLGGSVAAGPLEYLDHLGQAVRQAEEMVDAILEIARLGKRELECEPVDIGELLRELVASIGTPEGVIVSIESEWPTLRSEPTLLRQIFQNLITNAIKFNNSDPKRIEIGVAGKEPCKFYVRDNGIGMDARNHDKVFQLFRRLHTEAEYEGSGVGLAIVRKLAARLGGSVTIESKIGKGSTFFVQLPSADAADRHLAAECAPRYGAASRFGRQDADSQARECDM